MSSLLCDSALARVCVCVWRIAEALGAPFARVRSRVREKLCVCVRPCERKQSVVWRLKIKTIIRFRRYAIKVTSSPPPKENNSFLFIEFGCMWAAWRCRCCEQAVYRGYALHYFIPDPHPRGKKAAAERKTRRCSRRWCCATLCVLSSTPWKQKQWNYQKRTIKPESVRG